MARFQRKQNHEQCIWYHKMPRADPGVKSIDLQQR